MVAARHTAMIAHGETFGTHAARIAIEDFAVITSIVRVDCACDESESRACKKREYRRFCAP
jgi:hypothetical protein